MSYIAAFVIPVPTANLAQYKKMSQKMAKVWIDHGALEYVECAADDAKPGKVTSFPQSVKLKDGEIVMFGYIVYKSARDHVRVNKAAMADPRLAEIMNPASMPFDGKRAFFGGFRPIVEKRAK